MNRQLWFCCFVALGCLFLMFAWSQPTLADDKDHLHKKYENTKEYQEDLAKKKAFQKEKEYEDTVKWWEEWGTTIQIASAVILVGVVVLFLVIRYNKTPKTKDEHKPLIPPSPGGSSDPGPPR